MVFRTIVRPISGFDVLCASASLRDEWFCSSVLAVKPLSGQDSLPVGKRESVGKSIDCNDNLAARVLGFLLRVRFPNLIQGEYVLHNRPQVSGLYPIPDER